MTNEPGRRLKLPSFTDHCAVSGLNIEVSRYLLSSVSTPDVVEQAFERGINFFLLGADLHWPKYEATRIGLQRLLQRTSLRDEVVIAAISHMHQRNAAAVAFREVLDAVPQLGRLDMLVMGGAEERNFLPRLQEYRAYAKDEWMGAHLTGACFDDFQTAAIAIDARTIDIAFATFYAGRPGIRPRMLPERRREQAPPLYAFGSAHSYRTADELRDAGLPTTKWYPTRADYLRYALTWQAFDGVVCSSISNEGLEELADAIEKGPLDDEELAYLVDLDDLVNQRAQLVE